MRVNEAAMTESTEGDRHRSDGWSQISWVWWARAFALGSLVHITLPDFDQPGWTGPQILEGLGALILLWRPKAVGFVLCFIGTLWPLLFLRDVLTQSMLLTWMAAIGLYGTVGRRQAALDAVVWITAATYWLAALHKVNTDFLNPDISCGQHAVEQVAAHWTWFPNLNPGIELAVLIIGVEIAIGVLLVRRSFWAWIIGIGFHVPLTVTLAPAFAFVMFAGYAAALTPRQWVLIRRVISQRTTLVVLGALLLGLLEGTGQGEASVVTILKCVVLGSILAVAALAHRTTLRPRRLQVSRGPGIVLLLWVLHGLTPYMGVQYQHTAAMLSNLRIDDACHNSLIMPAALVMQDPYIRITSAEIGAGQRPAREQTLEAGLWSYPALATMHRNWCVDALRPIRLAGNCGGAGFLIEDLCADDWDERLPCRGSWPGFQRFQKNLKVACDVPCIH